MAAAEKNAVEKRAASEKAAAEAAEALAAAVQKAEAWQYAKNVADEIISSCEIIEFVTVQKSANVVLVNIKQCCKMNTHLRQSAAIQQRTSHPT